MPTIAACPRKVIATPPFHKRPSLLARSMGCRRSVCQEVTTMASHTFLSASARYITNGGRCFRTVDRLPSHRRRDIPSGVRGAMLTQVLHCPYCDETDIVRHGIPPHTDSVAQPAAPTRC